MSWQFYWIYCDINKLFVVNAFLVVQCFYLLSSVQISYAYSSASIGFNLKNNDGRIEELILTNVTSQDAFDYGKNVSSWKTLFLRGKTYAFGIKNKRRNVLTVLEISEDSVTKKLSVKCQDTDLNENEEIDLYEPMLHFNRNKNVNELLLVVTLKNERSNSNNIVWYRLNKQTLALASFWSWHLTNKRILHLNVGEYEKNCDKTLLVITKDKNEINSSNEDSEESDENEDKVYLKLYDIKFTSKKFWLSETIPLKCGSFSSEFVQNGGKTFLAITQKCVGKLFVYEYSENEKHFKLFDKIHSDLIDQVISFTHLSKNFLVINGDDPKILQFNTHSNDLIQKSVKHGILDDIHYYLGITIKNFYENVIILIQKSVKHQSHDSYVIEVILFDGNDFQLLEEVPCIFYGEVMEGVSCLIEDNHNEGIKGSAFVNINNRFIGVLIPHQKLPHSGLFKINMESKKLATPKERYLEKFRIRKEEIIQELKNNEMKDLFKSIEKKDDIEIKSRFRQTEDSQSQIDFDMLEKELLKFEEEINGIKDKLKTAIPTNTKIIKVNKLTFNEDVKVNGWISTEQLFIEEINNEVFNDVIQDVYQKSNPKNITGHKTFTNENVFINELHVQRTINEKEVNNLIFMEENKNEILINGNVEFTKTVNVNKLETSKLNGVKLSKLGFFHESNNEIVLNSNLMHFENLEVQNLILTKKDEDIKDFSTSDLLEILKNSTTFNSLSLNGDLSISSINNEEVDELFSNLLWKNKDETIKEAVTINGDITSLKSLNMQWLNNIKFPEEFITKDSDKIYEISGKKIFKNEVTCKEVYSQNGVNGVNLSKLFTLTTDQNLTDAKFIISNMELTESINITGNITGPHVEKYLEKNPTLLSGARNITSNLNFQELIVNGNLVIKNAINNKKVEDYLNDVVYKNTKNENSVFIGSRKTFPKGLIINELNVSSNSLNNILLEDFVTADTQQTMYFNTLNGDIKINNIQHLKGLFRGINVTELEMNTLRLDGDQYMSGICNFLDYVEFKNLKSNKENLNNDLNKNNNKVNEMVDISVDTLEVYGNFDGNISEVDLLKLNKSALRKEFRQEIANVEIDEVFVQNLQNTKIVNDQNFTDLLNVEKKLLSMLDQGKIDVELMEVSGSVIIDNHEFGCESSSENGILKINGNASFAHLNINKIGNQNFDELLKNIVFKNESDITFIDEKLFEDSIIVNQFIEAERINEIPIFNLMHKYQKQTIKAPIEINGDLFINGNAIVKHEFNNVNLKNLPFFSNKNGYFINGNVTFNEKITCKKLSVEACNDVSNLNEILTSVVQTNNQINEIKSNTIFENVVEINDDLTINNLANGKNLNEFYENVILINNDNEEFLYKILSFVNFTGDVKIEEELEVDNIKMEGLISSVNLENWKNAIFIDRGKINEKLEFKEIEINGNLQCEKINDFFVGDLIKLKMPLSQFNKLSINNLTLTNNADVKNFVNKLNNNLKALEKNTVRVNQIIFDSEIEFTNSVFVKGNVNINDGKLNKNLNLNNVVTLKEDQILNGTYYFDKISIAGDLNITGSLNGKKINSLKNKANSVQTIDTNVNVTEEINFEENVDGFAINNMDLAIFEENINNKSHLKSEAEQFFSDEYKFLCLKTQQQLEIAKKQAYLFAYFEEIQTLFFRRNVNFIQAFENNLITHVIINEKNSCKSSIFKWNGSKKGKFVFEKEINSGIIQQIIFIKSDVMSSIQETKFMLIRSDNSCNLSSNINLWSTDINKVNVKFESNIFQQQERINEVQQSDIPNAFYAKSESFVYQFEIKPKKNLIKAINKWNINKETLSFLPAIFKQGLALHDNKTMYKLTIKKSAKNEDLIKHFTIFQKMLLESQNDYVSFKVGKSKNKKKLHALITHDHSIIEHESDVIRIYKEEVSEESELFQKIYGHRISNLNVIEFGNGETLLVFLQNNSVEIYEYNGIFGFKKRSSLRIPCEKIIKTTTSENNTLLLLTHRNLVIVLKAKMHGNKIEYVENEEELQCKIN